MKFAVAALVATTAARHHHHAPRSVELIGTTESFDAMNTDQLLVSLESSLSIALAAVVSASRYE